jgi:hypothetical protein
MNLALRFLGVGNAQAVALGSACAVIERDGSPLLMIDCGPDALTAFLERYQSAPSARVSHPRAHGPCGWT